MGQTTDNTPGFFGMVHRMVSPVVSLKRGVVPPNLSNPSTAPVNTSIAPQVPTPIAAPMQGGIPYPRQKTVDPAASPTIRPRY